MANAGARKVLVISWMDADDIGDDVDFGETVKYTIGRNVETKVTTLPRIKLGPKLSVPGGPVWWPGLDTPKETPQKATEPTAEQLRARQREWVTRAAAVVQKAAEHLEGLGGRAEITEALFITGSYATTPGHGVKNPVANYLRQAVDDAFTGSPTLKVPEISTNWSGEVLINTDDFSLRMKLPEKVAEFSIRTLTTF